VADVLARHYAQALYLNAVHNPILLQRVRRELEGFVTQVAEKYPALTSYFDSRLIERSKENKVLHLLAQELELSDEVHGLLRSVVKNNRFYHLKEIFKAFIEIMEAGKASETAHVTAARPLSGEEQALIQKRLAKAVGKHIELQIKIDPAVLGGLRAEVEYKVFDDTLKHKLNRLKHDLVG
jgi:F-type H+-transporting ATPase subunit delta